MFNYKSMLLAIILASIIIFSSIEISLENFNQDTGFNKQAHSITAIYHHFWWEQYQHQFVDQFQEFSIWKQIKIMQVEQWWRKTPADETLAKIQCQINDLIRAMEQGDQNTIVEY
ncbi:MAG: hypothetical protein LRZ99_00230 [Desulfotomaculum sp.]|nr:hypothetical protein [Desulfotomaculum sp.]